MERSACLAPRGSSAERPGRTAQPRIARRTWLREAVLVVVLYFVYDLVHGAVTGDHGLAERDGWRLLHVEDFLHLDPEHALNNALQHVAALAVPACFFYATLHFLVTPAVLGWMFFRRRQDYRPARTVLAVTTAVALIGFWLYPTAPPRLLLGAGFHDTLAHYHSWGWWGADASVPTAAQAVANQFAAMPSLHLAWAAWCGVTIFRYARPQWLRILGLAYPVLTALVVLGTANHYLADVAAGAALWFAVDRLVAWRTRVARARAA